MNYTEEQLKKHGVLILKWLASGKTLEIQIKKEIGWVDSKPRFNPKIEYREAPKPLYVNSIGEKFYKNEGDVWFYDKIGGYVTDVCISSLSQFCGDEDNTEIFKTKSGAYQAAADYFKEKGE